MDQKLEILTKQLKDERGKKVIFVAHCTLNENTRYLGGAFRSGCIDEIVDELQKQGIGIVQLPCPEQKAWGGVLKKYLSYSVGSKGTPLYRFKWILLPLFLWNTRRICRKIAKETVMQIRDYIDSGFDVVGFVGIATSPTCGVKITVDIRQSFEFLAGTAIEKLGRKEMNELGIKKLLVNGEGFLVKALQDELKKKNIAINFYEHDLLSEMKGTKTTIDIN